jgi:hypothetical protein
MANTVNVTTANTFEQWRTKTNEIGTAIGDLDKVTVSDIGYTTIVAAVEAHQDIVVGSVTLSGGVQMTGNLDWADNAAIRMGTGDDLTISHNGTNTSLTNITGQLRIGGNDIRIQSQNHSEDYILCVDGGAVTLHHNDNAKIATTATGVDVTGVITADGLDVDDDHIIKIGTGDDLQLSHNGTDSIIDSNTGILKIQSDDARILNAAADETLIKAVNAGAVELYYDNSKKFETTTAGGTITGGLIVGAVTASGAISPASDSAIDLGTTGVRFRDAFVDSITVTGEIDGGSLDISGNADIDGTLEADAITINGTTLASTIQTTVGAMVSNNTESGLAVTYDAVTGTLDFDVIDPVITLTGDVTGSATMTNLGSVSIATTRASSSVSTDDIVDLNVTTAKIANDAVTEAKIADDAVSKDQLKSLVTLLIINSAGTTVKTLYGAGA